MISLKHYRLSTKLLFAVILRVLFAIFVTSFALSFLWQLENGGIAINHAGSLRMRVYRMIALLEQGNNQNELLQEEKRFVMVLNNLSNIHYNNVFFEDNKTKKQIKNIEQIFNTDILTIFGKYRNEDYRVTPEDFAKIEVFVSEIDDFVQMIENKNTRNIVWIRFLQILLIGVIIVIAFGEIYVLFKIVIRPLNTLKNGIKEISQGNLAERVPIIRNDEFGVVSKGFNHMADNLQDLYDNLEKKVSEKVSALEEKNREFSILYDMTAFLHGSHTQENMLKTFLKNIMRLGYANAGVIGLLSESNDHINFACIEGLPEDIESIQKCNNLTNCFFDISYFKNQTKTQTINVKDKNGFLIPECIKIFFNYIVVFPLRHLDKRIGFMVLYFHKDQPNPENHALIETLTSQLAISIENYQLALRDKQLAVLEERNLIAQGLHDSIAQSLSFLNLQIQMLKTALTQHEEARTQKSLAYIQRGIQECYDDVRELLLNFRTRIAQGSFKDTVHNLLARLEKQTGINVITHGLDREYFLTQEQELQVIFIFQEALSNIRKHSQAKNVIVDFSYTDKFVMSIKDDGCGFDKENIEKKKSNHVGLSIMAERAANIMGEVTIHSNPQHGTQVILTLPQKQ